MNVGRGCRWAVLAVVVTIAAACSDNGAPTAVESNSTSTTTASSGPTTDGATTTVAPEPTDAPTTTEESTTTESTAAPATTAVEESTTTLPLNQPEDLGLEAGCNEGESCISLALAEDGGLVSYDRATGLVTFYDASPTEIMLLPSVAENVLMLIAVGPDDVAYFVGQQPETVDPVGYAVAVSTHPDNAGEVVLVGTDVDLSGDSRPYSTPTGIVSVGCCGGDRRPAVDSPVVIPWVDHSGAPVTSDRPDVWIEYPGDGSATFHRADSDGSSSWSVDHAVTRSMPVLGALDDGGLIVDLTDPFDVESPPRLVRFSADGASSEASVAPATVVLVEPSGSVIADLDGRYVRLRPFG